MLELILRNAVNIRVDGVADSFLTPRGAIAGQFFAGHKFYDFEIEDDTVYYQPAYRMDSAKGKKCPGGYWIPKKHECRQGTMTPSAKGKTGGIKAALATAAIAGVAAGGVMVAKNRMSGGGAMPTQPNVEVPTPPAQPEAEVTVPTTQTEVEATVPQKKGLGTRVKELAGDRRVQIATGVVGAGAIAGGTALALGKRKKGEAVDPTNSSTSNPATKKAGDPPSPITPSPGAVDNENNALGKKKEQQQKQTEKRYTVSEEDIEEQIRKSKEMGEEIDRNTAMEYAQEAADYRARAEEYEKGRKQSPDPVQKNQSKIDFPINGSTRDKINTAKEMYPDVYAVAPGKGSGQKNEERRVKDISEYEVSQEEVNKFLGWEGDKPAYEDPARYEKERQRMIEDGRTANEIERDIDETYKASDVKDEVQATLALKGRKREEDIRKYGSPQDKQRIKNKDEQRAFMNYEEATDKDIDTYRERMKKQHGVILPRSQAEADVNERKFLEAARKRDEHIKKHGYAVSEAEINKWMYSPTGGTGTELGSPGEKTREQIIEDIQFFHGIKTRQSLERAESVVSQYESKYKSLASEQEKERKQRGSNIEDEYKAILEIEKSITEEEIEKERDSALIYRSREHAIENIVNRKLGRE